MQADFNHMIRDILRIGQNIRVLYDRELQKYHIGWAQQFLLLYIAEHPGVTAQELSDIFQADKSTISKGLKRLKEEGYIQIETDEKDRRARKLYSTETAATVTDCIVEVQRNLCERLADAISEEEKLRTEKTLRKIDMVSAADGRKKDDNE